MPKVSVPLYDFLALVCVGAVVIGAADYSFEMGWGKQADASMWGLFLMLIGSFVMGHVVAQLSYFILERGLIARVLGGPEDVLFDNGGTRSRALRASCPGYFRKLPTAVQRRVLERAGKVGIEKPGPALFHHARVESGRDERTFLKLEAFLTQYGFARNMTLSLLASAIIVSLGTRAWGELRWVSSAVLLLGSVIMCYRYLKFYRQYSFELFTSFPEVPSGS